MPLLLLVCLAGCGGPPRLDCSSEEALAGSIARMREALGPDRARELAGAMTLLSLPALMRASAEAGKEAPRLSKAEVFRPFDGMSAEEIIAKAGAARPGG
jgi:hypothetical protein